MRTTRSNMPSKKIIVILLGMLLAQQAIARPVQRHLPLAFSADSGELRTSVCAMATEHVYEDEAWWKNDVKNLEPQQRAVKSVFDAILRKDRKALDNLSDGSDSAQARSQLEMMVKTSDLLKTIDAVHLYEVAPLLIVFARMHNDGRTGIGTFVFVKRNANYSLLPLRPRAAAFELVRDWANSEWGVLNASGPGFCSAEEVTRTDHRVTVSSASNADIRVVMPVEMKLVSSAGKPIKGGTASRVIRVYAQMREAIRKDSFARLVSFVSPGDAKALGDFASNPQFAGQRATLKAVLLDQEPVAVVDGGPMQVLYTRTKTGGDVTAWYFVVRGNSDPQWANLATIATVDAVFKTGPLFEAARTDPSLEMLRKQPAQK